MNKPPPHFTPNPRLRHYAWDYLSNAHAEPADVDPARDLGVHPDDLPAGWDAPEFVTHGPTGEVTTMGRVEQALQAASHYLAHAFVLAGFAASDASRFAGSYSTVFDSRMLVGMMWHYRRFGIPLAAMPPWLAAGLSAPVARVYIDAGVPTEEAVRLRSAAHEAVASILHNRERVSEAARIELLCLDHGVAPAMAVLFWRAGVAHHEVPDWLVEHHGGRDITADLAVLEALRGT